MTVFEDESYIYINCTFIESVYLQAKFMSDIEYHLKNYVECSHYIEVLEPQKGYYFKSWHDLYDYLKAKIINKKLGDLYD